MFAKLEQQRYGRNKDTLINHAYICGGEFRRKFDQITTDNELNKLLYAIAKTILFHRSGTVFEDMYWIDAETVKVVASITDSTVAHAIRYNGRIYKTIRKYDTLITIHSHPSSMPPSYNDLMSNYEHGYQLGVIVCHNGTVYIYSVLENIPENYYRIAAGDYVRMGYNEPDAFLQVLNELNDTGRILFREVTADHDL